MRFLINKIKDESGAVTVDWVILTAAVVGLSIGAITMLLGGQTEALADAAATRIAQENDF